MLYVDCRYEGADFDSAVVDTLYNICLKCIQEKAHATAEEVGSYVNSTVRSLASPPSVDYWVQLHSRSMSRTNC